MKQVVTLDWDDISEAISDWCKKKNLTVDFKVGGGVEDIRYEGNKNGFSLGVDLMVKPAPVRGSK